MLKKCMPLWREAHSQVKVVKAVKSGVLLEVEMLKKRVDGCGAKHMSKSKC